MGRVFSGPDCWCNNLDFCPFRVWHRDRCPNGSSGSGEQYPPGGSGAAGCLEIGHHCPRLERVFTLPECTLTCPIWDGKDRQPIADLKYGWDSPWAHMFLLCFCVTHRPPTLCTSNQSPHTTWKPTSACMENLTMAGCIDPWAQGLAGPVQWANPWRTADGAWPHPVNDAVLGICGLFFSKDIDLHFLFDWGCRSRKEWILAPFGETRRDLHWWWVCSHSRRWNSAHYCQETTILCKEWVPCLYSICFINAKNASPPPLFTVHPDLHWTATILHAITSLIIWGSP